MDTRRPAGTLTLEELQALVEDGQIDTVIAAFPDLYGRLVGKRIEAGFFLEQVAPSGMHVCDYLLTVDMEMDVVEGYAFANWDKGYGDFHCVADMGTLRRIAWLERTALVLCDVVDEETHERVDVAPRSLLRAQVDRLSRRGWQAAGGSEIEYYLFKESYESAQEKGYNGLEPFGAYLEDYHLFQGTKEEGINGAVRRHMHASGIPVEFSKGEWGPGQHELNLRYAEVLEMADRHVVYKQGFKEIAWSQGLAVTFMAKWRADLAGSSMHLHLSLWQDGKNLFAEDGETYRHFLGGWMRHARALSPFYAPYPNSYKRYVYQSWAPTRVAWSRDNRTAGFRLVGAGQARRLECRLPGADANPYLAYAATLAAGLDGIENGTEPPAEFVGDAYGAEDVPQVPANLREATDEMEQSAMLRAAWGEAAVDHYVHFFRTEQRKYDESVSDWERARYFERG